MMNGKKKDTKFTVISISVETQKKIKMLAEKDKRTIRGFIDFLLEEYENTKKDYF